MNTIQKTKSGAGKPGVEDFRRSLQNIFNLGIFPYLFFLIIIFIVYAKSIMFGITELDDLTLVISQYEYLKDPYNIIDAFFKSVFNESADTFYRPLLTVSWIIDTIIGRGRLWVYHFFDIIYHFTAVCILFNILKNLNISRLKAFAFASFFAALPIFNQAVSWIPGRNDTLLAVFIFSSFLFLVKYNNSEKFKHIFISALFFLAALFTKETAFAAIIVFPFFFILNASSAAAADASPVNAFEDSRRAEAIRAGRLKIKLISFIMLFAACVLLWYLMKTAFTGTKEMNILYLVVFTKAALIKLFPATLQYVAKIFLPVNLKVLPVLSLFDSLLGAAVAAFIVLLLAQSKNIKRSNVFFGILWFVMFLVLPYFQNNYFMLEHRTYAAVFGLILIINEINLNGKIKTVLPYLIAVYFIFFISVSLINAEKFANKLNFAAAAMIETPLNVKATFLYGRRSLDNGTFQFGEYFMKKNYEDLSIKAKQRSNVSSSAYLGIFIWQRGDMKSAKKYLTIAADKDTKVHQVYGALADIYIREGRYKEAVFNMKKAFKMKPENPEYFRYLKFCFEKINNKQ
ncbi:MAG: hypothetical protein FWH43_07045 [Endomicrobia bacterium]|nr:hypothetical protein [Endomicrobiia bacterium]